MYIDTKYKIMKIETATSSTSAGTTIETKFYHYDDWTKLNVAYNGTSNYEMSFKVIN